MHITANTAGTLLTIDEVGSRADGIASGAGGDIGGDTRSRRSSARLWMLGTLVVLAMWLARWMRVRVALHRATAAHGGPVLVTVRRLERQLGERRALRVLHSDATIEPGIVGVLRPALLLPAGVEEKLSGAAPRSHPGPRALSRAAARQRTGDGPHAGGGTVLVSPAGVVDRRATGGKSGSGRATRRCCNWATSRKRTPRGILRVCQFYVETSLACASGVTGADLKRRIESIMTHTAAPGTRLWQRGLLAAAAVSVVATPVLFGMVTAPVRYVPANSTRKGPKEMRIAKLKFTVAPLFLSFVAGAQQPPPASSGQKTFRSGVDQTGRPERPPHPDHDGTRRPFHRQECNRKGAAAAGPTACATSRSPVHRGG